MTPLLIGLDYSPWTQRAAWALHLAGIETRFVPYTPTLGEPRLRWALRRPGGQVSVPVLLRVPRGPVEDSFDIARWAAEHASTGAPELFPDLEEVRRWNDLANGALSYGRRRAVAAMVDNPRHLDEASSKEFPRVVAPLLRPVARAIAKRTVGKYDAPPRRALGDALAQLRVALGHGRYLLGNGPTYADVVMATMLEVVRPGSQTARGPEETHDWTDTKFAEQYPDLLEWRDGLLAETGFTGVR